MKQIYYVIEALIHGCGANIIKLILEIGDNFIVLNNVVWKRIGFLYYDRLLKKRD